MRTLEVGRGRDDYPVRAIGNSVLAGIVFQHPSIESLRRELSQNGQLRVLCSFADPHSPPASASARFLRRVMDPLPMIAALFDRLVDAVSDVLPDFGVHLAVDSKAWRNRPDPDHEQRGLRRSPTNPQKAMSRSFCRDFVCGTGSVSGGPRFTNSLEDRSPGVYPPRLGQR